MYATSCRRMHSSLCRSVATEKLYISLVFDYSTCIAFQSIHDSTILLFELDDEYEVGFHYVGFMLK